MTSRKGSSWLIYLSSFRPPTSMRRTDSNTISRTLNMPLLLLSCGSSLTSVSSWDLTMLYSLRKGSRIHRSLNFVWKICLIQLKFDKTRKIFLRFRKRKCKNTLLLNTFSTLIVLVKKEMIIFWKIFKIKGLLLLINRNNRIKKQIIY